MKCADMADAFDDGYKRGFNAAIDKVVEVVTACGDDMPWYIWDAFVKGIIEELKKLKEGG